KYIDWRDKAISPPVERLDKARVVSVVAERLPDAANGLVEALLEIDERIERPQLFLQLLTSNHLARPLQQQGEHIQRLPCELNLHSLPAQLSCSKIQFEDTEACPLRVANLRLHCPSGWGNSPVGTLYHRRQWPSSGPIVG